MSAQIIDGKELQAPIVERVREKVAASGVTPRLDLITVRHDSADVVVQSELTFGLHVSFFSGLGCEVREHKLPTETTTDELVALIHTLNADDTSDGILVLVPTPAHIALREVITAIDPAKELEGLHPRHIAALMQAPAGGEVERQMLVPATLRAVLAAAAVDFGTAHLVIVVEREALRGNVITQTVARFGSGLIWPSDTTLTVTHTEHPNLPELCRQADVLMLVVQTKPGLVRGDWVKPGAAVFDFNAILVGTAPHPQDPTRQVPVMRGGADNEEVAAVAKVLCPAPRGFGPVMLALLAENLVTAADKRRGRG